MTQENVKEKEIQEEVHVKEDPPKELKDNQEEIHVKEDPLNLETKEHQAQQTLVNSRIHIELLGNKARNAISWVNQAYGKTDKYNKDHLQKRNSMNP